MIEELGGERAPLRASGVTPMLLTGDNADAARAAMAGGRTVAMAGDGINDAPALAAADVGIAMAGGLDVAMHAAGITLMRGDLRLVLHAIDIPHRTYRKIRLNLGWAFIHKLVGIELAAFGRQRLFQAPARCRRLTSKETRRWLN